MMRFWFQVPGAVLLGLCLNACNQASKLSEGAGKGADLVSANDYPSLYCRYAPTLKLRYYISPELGRMCKDGKPTADFIALREEGLKYAKLEGTSSNDLPYNVRFLSKAREEKTDTSRFEIVWVFHVPTRPYIVKAKPLYTYVAQGFHPTESNFLTLDVKAKKLDDATLSPGGLHLWSAEMDYTLTVKPLPELTLNNQRSTQYNLYQVMSGNEEMGLGV